MEIVGKVSGINDYIVFKDDKGNFYCDTEAVIVFDYRYICNKKGLDILKYFYFRYSVERRHKNNKIYDIQVFKISEKLFDDLSEAFKKRNLEMSYYARFPKIFKRMTKWPCYIDKSKNCLIIDAEDTVYYEVAIEEIKSTNIIDNIIRTNDSISVDKILSLLPEYEPSIQYVVELNPIPISNKNIYSDPVVMDRMTGKIAKQCIQDQIILSDIKNGGVYEIK